MPQIPAFPLPMTGTCQQSLATSVFLPHCWGMGEHVALSSLGSLGLPRESEQRALLLCLGSGETRGEPAQL